MPRRRSKLPPADLAQYGVGVFSLGLLGYLLGKAMDALVARRREVPSSNGSLNAQALATIVKENTEAITRLTSLLEIREEADKETFRRQTAILEGLARSIDHLTRITENVDERLKEAMRR